ncbi:TetR/AcrR family transcriptional regulator [Auraticoccus monumenti]|uniref:Regulatory protein, tetR family n=1 Tax=Auraticoccus monumenti TaxID=675864 RepID=A0A1G6TP05_9ACTN|nr:TetR/AcrR family transcriptional regulator [Auraticoccus monumenti]SDD30780.1 regulatory protein, tetR family [Auraticoccus monumenti]
MPRIVDHEQRRRDIARAVWRLLERDGLRGASVRAVVAESGLSSGAIRHYFSTQDDLLRFAGRIIRDEVPDRLLGVLKEPGPDPQERACRLLEELVPLDDRRRTELLVAVALAELERTSPGQDREFIDASHAGLRVLTRLAVLVLVGRAVELTPVDPLEPGLEEAAARLHLLADGVCAQHLFYPGVLTPEDLRASLRDGVEQVGAALGVRPTD